MDKCGTINHLQGCPESQAWTVSLMLNSNTSMQYTTITYGADMINTIHCLQLSEEICHRWQLPKWYWPHQYHWPFQIRFPELSTQRKNPRIIPHSALSKWRFEDLIQLLCLVKSQSVRITWQSSPQKCSVFSATK
jgi:hypothetical protein